MGPLFGSILTMICINQTIKNGYVYLIQQIYLARWPICAVYWNLDNLAEVDPKQPFADSKKPHEGGFGDIKLKKT